MSYGKIADGIWRMSDTPPILVESEEKLAEITGADPGQLAITAVLDHMWMLDTDGTTWKAVGASAAPDDGSDDDSDAGSGDDSDAGSGAEEG